MSRQVVQTAFGPIATFPVLAGMTKWTGNGLVMNMTKKITGKDAQGNPTFQNYYDVPVGDQTGAHWQYVALDSRGGTIDTTPGNMLGIGADTGFWGRVNSASDTAFRGLVFVVDASNDPRHAGDWYQGWPYLNADGEPIDSNGDLLTAPKPQLTTVGQLPTFYVQGDKPQPASGVTGVGAGLMNSGPGFSSGISTMGGGTGNAMTTNQTLMAWIAPLIRLYTNFRTQPVQPTPTKVAANSTVNQDVANLLNIDLGIPLTADMAAAVDFELYSAYLEALAQFAIGNSLIDAISRAIEVALRQGRSVPQPTPAMIDALKGYLKPGVNAIFALRTPPARPSLLTSPKPTLALGATGGNIANLANYATSMAQFVNQADLADTAMGIVEKILSNQLPY